ncbi:organic cation transporter protein-like [Palaemon carinicauda]|uniref:organic cation transporter protein-like n=1 Tax=Palaemon carinicauda TaxID=392227 RepID=UPI0035B62B39
MISNKFEDLLTSLGTGKWNFLYFICDMYVELILPAHAMNGVFMAPEVKYTCIPPDQPNVAGVSEDSCKYYVNTTTAEGNTTRESFPCTEWDFDNTTYVWTLTTEFELVCGRAYLRATYQSIQMIATLLTCSLFGYFCDRYGRKTMLVVSQVIHSVLCLSIVLSYNFPIILALTIPAGMFCSECGPFFCVVSIFYADLTMEVCELKWRSMCGIIIALPWAFGMMVWGGAASVLGNWRMLQLAVSLPLFLRIGFHFFIDESPRWLILKGREDQAIKVLRKAARWNGAQLPTDERLREIFKEIQLEQKVDVKKEKKEKKELSDYVPTLLRTPKMRSYTILFSCLLLAASIVYAGLNLSGDNYSKDPFLYMVLCGVMEIPGYTVAAPLINWLGKKKPMFFLLNFCGVAVLALAFIPKDINWLFLSLAMVGKLCNSMAFMVFFVYLNELLPTEVRMQGVNVGFTMTCIGGAVAPYITDYLAPLIPWVPSVIFGISSIVASFLLLPLPETKGRPMLETVEALEGHSSTKDGHKPVKQNGDTTSPNDEQKQFVEA